MDKVEQILVATGVVVLRNEMKEFMGLQIVGVDYPEREGQKDNPVLKEIVLDRSKTVHSSLSCSCRT